MGKVQLESLRYPIQLREYLIFTEIIGKEKNEIPSHRIDRDARQKNE